MIARYQPSKRVAEDSLMAMSLLRRIAAQANPGFEVINEKARISIPLLLWRELEAWNRGDEEGEKLDTY